MPPVTRQEAILDLPPAWPAYVPDPVQRVLAVMVGDGRILLETGEYLDEPANYTDFCTLLFQRNLQLYIGGVWDAMRPWTRAVVRDLDREAGHRSGRWTELQWNNNRTELTGLSVHKLWPAKNSKMCWQVRKATVSSAWARAIEPALLHDLRALFALLETGVCATPGQVGYHTMARLWRGKKPAEFRKHYRPPLVLVRALEQHAIGSRREAYRPEEIFEECYELDASNGYCSQTHELPAGFATYFHDGNQELWTRPRSDIFTWWGEAYVSIYDNGLAPGDVASFATRDDDGQLHWPTAPGQYHTYIWSWEAEELRRRELAGEPIRCLGIGEAWAWTQKTTQLQAWQTYMDQKRREAKAISKELSDLVKIVIVAAIGRLGLPYELTTVWAEDGEGRIPLEGDGVLDIPLYASTEFQDTGTPKHWQSYILGKMNYRVYEEMRRCYLEGIPVIGCNVDGILVEKRAYWCSDPEFVRLGEFKIKKLGSWVANPGPGIIIDPDNLRVQVPGMSRLEKDRAMGLYRIGEKHTRRRGEKPNQAQLARETFRRAGHAEAMRLREYILQGRQGA